MWLYLGFYLLNTSGHWRGAEFDFPIFRSGDCTKLLRLWKVLEIGRREEQHLQRQRPRSAKPDRIVLDKSGVKVGDSSSYRAGTISSTRFYTDMGLSLSDGKIEDFQQLFCNEHGYDTAVCFSSLPDLHQMIVEEGLLDDGTRVTSKYEVKSGPVTYTPLEDPRSTGNAVSADPFRKRDLAIFSRQKEARVLLHPLQRETDDSYTFVTLRNIKNILSVVQLGKTLGSVRSVKTPSFTLPNTEEAIEIWSRYIKSYEIGVEAIEESIDRSELDALLKTYYHNLRVLHNPTANAPLKQKRWELEREFSEKKRELIRTEFRSCLPKLAMAWIKLRETLPDHTLSELILNEDFDHIASVYKRIQQLQISRS